MAVTKAKPYFYPTLLSGGALLVCLCSPLHPFANNSPNVDSSSFMLFGKLMAQGVMPYRDIFDHKGPLIYVFNWLGMLAGRTGVWVIELACMLLSVWFCYKTARRFYSEAAAFLGTTATFAALLSWYEGGNFVESYALPFMFVALYCLTGYYVQGFELTSRQVLISGICMGGILMLRPNMIGLWVGMCAAIFVHSAIIKKYTLLPRYVLCFAAGLVVSVAPFIIWLGLYGGLGDFYRCYILFNFAYIDVPSQSIAASAWHAFRFPIVTLTAAIPLSLLFKKGERNSYRFVLDLSLISMFAATVCLLSLSGRLYLHYYLVLLPCIVLPMARLSEMAISHFQIMPAAMFLSICIILNQSISDGKRMMGNTLWEDHTGKAIATFIRENTLPDEPILYIGAYSRIYLLSDRPPAGYYHYFSSNIPIDQQNYLAELSAKKPRVVAYGNRELQAAVTKYIDENYTVVYEVDEHKVCLIRE
jgi:hypothetical protein